MKYKDTAVYDIPQYICSTLAYRYNAMAAWQFATTNVPVHVHVQNMKTIDDWQSSYET